MTRAGLIFDDRYRLDERIAAGGVGQVWQATDLLVKRLVAVKVLRPEYADHPETLARFRKEAEHAGALNHPCVARVHYYGNAAPDGPPYLVMELVGGPSLAKLLTVGPLEPAHALDVIAQSASGLQAAHQAGLVHRDVKPGNILIGPDGQVKITDFGVAHAAGQTPVTGPGLVMGTTLYMAPERISGGPGTPASDLYALGIVLHECLTGMPPYEGSPTEVMAAHLYLPLPTLPAGVPPELDTLVARLTAKDPAKRISDAGELAAAAAKLRDTIAASTRDTHTVSSRDTIATSARDTHTVRHPPATVRSAESPPRPTSSREPAFPWQPIAPREPAIPDNGARTGAGPGSQSPWATVPDGSPVGAAAATTAPPGAQPPARSARHAHGSRSARRAHGRDRRPHRRTASLAAGAALLTGAGLVALLVSGALRTAPIVVRGPGSSTSSVIPTLAALPSPTTGSAAEGAGNAGEPKPMGTITSAGHEGGTSTPAGPPNVTAGASAASSGTPGAAAGTMPSGDASGGAPETSSPTPNDTLSPLPDALPTLHV